METIKQYFSELGKKGGKARAASMTPKERSELARKGAKAKWEKAKREGGK